VKPPTEQKMKVLVEEILNRYKQLEDVSTQQATQFPLAYHPGPWRKLCPLP
jgi:hypothetical protein